MSVKVHNNIILGVIIVTEIVCNKSTTFPIARLSYLETYESNIFSVIEFYLFSKESAKLFHN